MIKIAKVGLVVLMGSSMLIAAADQAKMYDVKSGKITYETKGSGNIMGMVQTKTIGKKRVIFDEYGVKSLSEENKVEKKTTNGKTEVIKTHTMTYTKGSMLYKADFEKKRIMRMQNPAAMMMAMAGGQNMMKAGEEMMKQMGGKKTGTDKVLGYTCDIWEMMGTKQCLYKGISLKIEMDVMGMKSTTVATKAEFNKDLNKDDFKMPDFPIYDIQGNKLDKSKLNTLDKQAEVQADKAGEEMAELGNVMAAAMQSAGVKKGERATEVQEEAMKSSMMDAMWPRMKKKILAESKALEFAKECFSDAGTLKEANICSHKMDEMSGEMSDPEDDLTEWNAKTKKETLGFIDQGLKSMECAKKANSMQDMQQCMPQEQKKYLIKLYELNTFINLHKGPKMPLHSGKV